MRHRWTSGHARSTAFSDAYIQLGNDFSDFISCRLCFIFRRHFAGIDFLTTSAQTCPSTPDLKSRDN